MQTGVRKKGATMGWARRDVNGRGSNLLRSGVGQDCSYKDTAHKRGKLLAKKVDGCTCRRARTHLAAVGCIEMMHTGEGGGGRGKMTSS
jgi:hypothetical protein